MKTKTIGKVTVKSNREFSMITPERESLMKALSEEKNRFKKKLARELKQLERDYHEARGRVKVVSQEIEQEKRRLEVVKEKIKRYFNKIQYPDKLRTRAMDKIMQGEKIRLRQLESMLLRYNDLLNNIKQKRHDTQKRIQDEHYQNIDRIRMNYYQVLKQVQRMKNKSSYNL